MRISKLGRLKALIRAASINILLVSVSMLIAALLAEGFVRLIVPQQLILLRPDIWQPDSGLGWVVAPNVDTEVNTGERTVTFRSDEDGFRIGRDGRREGERQILWIGDSFVQALQVEHEESFGSFLEESLSDSLGTTVAVRNAGVDGWDPNQYLLRARSLAERDSFDLVIVFFYLGNDIVQHRTDRIEARAVAQRHGLRLPRRLTWGEFINAFLLPINDFLEVRSHLFIFCKTRLKTLRTSVGLSRVHVPHELVEVDSADSRWSMSAELSEDLASEFAGRDTPTLFVLLPAPYQINPLAFEEHVAGLAIDSIDIDLDLSAREIHREFSSKGLNVLDPLSSFRSAFSGGTQLYGSIDRHLSPAGHEYLAELVLPEALALMGARDSMRLHTSSN